MAKKVLVVDDSPTVRQQVGIVLREAGYEVIEAEHGLDGKEKIETQPDLCMVICDVNMPHMNGIELVAAVSAGRPNLPIVMLTTEGHPDLVMRAKKAGAKGWLVKPFKPALLVATIAKLAGAA